MNITGPGKPIVKPRKLTNMPRSDMNEREFISAIKKCALADLPRKLPNDAEKTEQDWAERDRQSQWEQDAFNEFFFVGSAYLDATKGGLQTSRDIHMFCQGFASAVTAILGPPDAA